MSIIQAFIGTIGASAPSGPNWVYPPVGNYYPITGSGLTGTVAGPVSGYYEASSLLNTPNLGLYRRTYAGMAFSDSFQMDTNFPASYTEVENQADQYVGFGSDMDVNTQFTMEWIGFFKPAQSGDFVFMCNVDDYVQMWIGQSAVSGFNNTNTILQGGNSTPASVAYTMTADKYYPVRIRYVENQGGHNCTIWSGLNETTLANNMQTASTGQFFFDTYAATGSFPPTGLIT